MVYGSLVTFPSYSKNTGLLYLAHNILRNNYNFNDKLIENSCVGPLGPEVHNLPVYWACGPS